MIFGNKPLANVEEEDLVRLVEVPFSESRRLEYKLEWYPSNKSGKKELLFDIISLANAAGGYIIVGIGEKKDSKGQNTGIPKKVAGIDVPNKDKFILDLENLVLSSIDERIAGLNYKIVDLSNGKQVVIIKIPASHRAPHMVTLDSTNKFYIRHERRKSLMDVRELKDAFQRSFDIMEKAESSLKERLDSVKRKLQDEYILYMSALPLFKDVALIDVADSEIDAALKNFDILNNIWFSLESWSIGTRISHLGIKREDSRGPEVLLMRDGYLEAIRHFNPANEEKLIYSRDVEFTFYNFVEKLGFLYNGIQIYSPILLNLSLLNVKGYRLSIPQDPISLITRGNPPWGQQHIEIFQVVQDLNQPIDNIIKPFCDYLWQCFGFKSSRNFGANGKLKWKA